ncbi:glutamine amidotransferase [Halosimplex carlsbadense 2-9-1]|uniref:Glutamine amidotransferase n=1 Tax=Halosimplex carlsbadense 2-9-1 TaxID=797114 RepID=M0D0K9_9EURY|nr:type 1 glutamine amidotransferase [Halosimplex carlsbadense]ELZ28227.1 glutamine amidotransferase [Halosimplex carlsbadense 2-9-1]
MTRPRIALLNAAHEAEGNRRNFRRELDADLTEFHLPTGQYPETFEFDGAVVTGSRASVYWDEEWIPPTKDWVGEAIDRGLPFLGVCYGHQLLADVLGGTVEDMGEYEIGYRTVEQSTDSVLFEGIDDDFTVFTTHSDYVAQLPPDAERLAANDYGVHGFREGRVFGVQFHPEYDMDTAAEVTVGKEGQLSEDRIQSVLDGITPENFDAACEAKQVFDNFLAFVREVDAGGAATGDDAVASDD